MSLLLILLCPATWPTRCRTDVTGVAAYVVTPHPHPHPHPQRRHPLTISTPVLTDSILPSQQLHEGIHVAVDGLEAAPQLPQAPVRVGLLSLGAGVTLSQAAYQAKPQEEEGTEQLHLARTSRTSLLLLSPTPARVPGRPGTRTAPCPGLSEQSVCVPQRWTLNTAMEAGSRSERLERTKVKPWEGLYEDGPRGGLPSGPQHAGGDDCTLCEGGTGVPGFSSTLGLPRLLDCRACPKISATPRTTSSSIPILGRPLRVCARLRSPTGVTFTSGQITRG